MEHSLQHTALMALDTEFRPAHFGQTAETVGAQWPASLLQVAVQRADGSRAGYFVDLDALQRLPGGIASVAAMLRPYWTSHGVLKLGHHWLHDRAALERRGDAELSKLVAEMVGFMDTTILFKAIWPLHHRVVGLADLVAMFLRQRLNKAERLTDWMARPLSETQLSYAFSDVDALLQLYPLLLACA
jgi:hypothetical protein